jgi:epoxide hydrolase
MTLSGCAAGPEINAFAIHIVDDELQDLHTRLERTRWPDEIEGSSWTYGIPLGYVKELASDWLYKYNWRTAETRLNEWPQFTTVIDAETVHFAHIRSPEPDAIPMLMSHGWPSTFAEFLEVAGPLTDPRAHGGDPADAFHLVLPSIPGYGFSGPTRHGGWDHRRIAGAYIQLMQRLGYSRYGLQGSDWGAFITSEIGRTMPERVIGLHLNLLPPDVSATALPDADELATLEPAEQDRVRASFQRNQDLALNRSGYAIIQGTRPQTLAYGLTDSPAGLLAWIAEKFAEWSDWNSQADEAVTRNQMLTAVSIYWFTGTANSSARLYYEATQTFRSQPPPAYCGPPTGIAVFPKDIFIPLRHLAESSFNIVHWTELSRGGHFPAMEQPQPLVDDIREFFRLVRP